jgi:hypothetical protein
MILMGDRRHIHMGNQSHSNPNDTQEERSDKIHMSA